MSNINKKQSENEVSIELNTCIQKLSESVFKDHSLILDDLLKQVKPVNFNDAVLEDGSKSGSESESESKNVIRPNRSQYIIYSIEHLINLATLNKWNLCIENTIVYLFNGAYWKKIDQDIFLRFLGKVSEKQSVPKHLSKHYKFKEELYRQFISTGELGRSSTENDKVKINLKNGTLEVSATSNTYKLKDFNADDFLKYQLPFSYDESAFCQMWRNYLNEVLPDQDCQKVLQEYSGYILIKHSSKRLKLEKALILYGSGANGKSVFYDVMNSLIGKDNISTYTLQQLTEEKGFYRSMIQDKLLNYGSELSSKMDKDIFKQMVSGEGVGACYKYGQPFEMNDYGKFIFNCNLLPKDIEQSHGFYRRFLIIPFEKTIEKSKQIEGLAQKIITEEVSGVFNWLLEGLKRLLQNGKFTESEKINNAVEQFNTDSDSVKSFIDDGEYQKSVNYSIDLKSLLLEYRSYCIDNGFYPVSRNTLSQRLHNYGYKKERKNTGYVFFMEKANQINNLF